MQVIKGKNSIKKKGYKNMKKVIITTVLILTMSSNVFAGIKTYTLDSIIKNIKIHNVSESKKVGTVEIELLGNIYKYTYNVK